MLPKHHCRTFGCLQKELRFERNLGQDATSKRRPEPMLQVEEPQAGAIRSPTRLKVLWHSEEGQI